MMDRPSGQSDWNESRNGSGPNSPDIYDRPGLHPPHPLFHPAALHHLRPPLQTGSPTNQTTSGNTEPNANKPKIWSVAAMASKENNKDESNGTSNSASIYHSSPGKILSPLAARGLHPLHHPYIRPELYRNFYGPSAAHLASPHDAALLESYQRTFGNLGHNGIPLTVLPKGPPFGPLSLTTSPSINNNNHHHHHPLAVAQPPRASPASSTSSTPEHTSPEKSLPHTSTPVTPIPINVTKP